MYVAATSDRTKKFGDQGAVSGEKRMKGCGDCVTMNKAFTHYRSRKQDDRGCWKRFKCHKCGRKMNPSEKCLHVCAACVDIHDCGKCPMENI